MKSSYSRTCIKVAGLCFELECAHQGTRFFLPECHEKFVDLEGGSNCQTQIFVSVHPGQEGFDETEAAFICRTDIWDLQFSDQGDWVFSTKRNNHPKKLILRGDYSHADVLGCISIQDDVCAYPLENLDMLVMVNWLAEQADLALHASGVILDDRTYAFLGKSGAGKSTLAAALQKDHNAQVLGEDQVILRYEQNKFWLYGTPWHENPAMCSPRGAALSGLFFLDRNSKRGLHEISAVDGVSRIMQTAFVPYYRRELIPPILERLSCLAAEIPFFSLNYPLGQDVYSNYLQTI